MGSFPHKSGITVHFPRILRWRLDKPAAEADILDTLHALLPRLEPSRAFDWPPRARQLRP